jgi:hypothetical protein
LVRRVREEAPQRAHEPLMLIRDGVDDAGEAAARGA